MFVSLKVVAVAATFTAGGLAGVAYHPQSDDPTELVGIPAGRFSYRTAGEFLRDGVPVNAPLIAVTFDRPLLVMKRQVSGGEYQACVRAGACKPPAAPAIDRSLPVVGVSFADAIAYAAWLSRETGHRYRLPSDAEWAYLAADRFHDDALASDGDAANPAGRWLQAYESETAMQRATGPDPWPFGSFGANRNGVQDLSGNVWDWTETCFTRHSAGNAADTALESCGVRVVEGAHRTYLSDFIRNPRGGACSVGAPPANLGIRLVRDEGTLLDRLARTLWHPAAPEAGTGA